MSPPRISFPDLMKTARSFPAEVRVDSIRLTFTMAITIIRHFSGKQWGDHICDQDGDDFPGLTHGISPRHSA
jgi:hypothetical protein